MTTEIAAFITALRHATDIVKTAIQSRDERKRQDALAELKGAFAELQVRHLAVAQSQQALLEQNEALKEQLAAYDKWEQEKTRYKRENVGAGVIVLSLDPAQASGEALHWLCPHCYEGRKKGVFQRFGRVPNHYRCDGCGSEIDAVKRYPAA